MVCLTPALESAVETQVTSLGRELVAVGFITSSEYEWLTRSPFQRMSDQAANLVRLIIQKVREDSQSYQKFIGVLEKDQLQYGSIIGSFQRIVVLIRRQPLSSSTNVGYPWPLSLSPLPSTWIHQSPQQHSSLPGPSRPESPRSPQGWFKEPAIISFFIKFPFMFYVALIGHNMSTGVEQSLLRFPGSHTESQRSSAITTQSTQLHVSQFYPNLPFLSAGQFGGGLLPFTPHQLVCLPPRQCSLPEPSGLPPPPQG